MSSFYKEFDHLNIPLTDIRIATKSFQDANLIKQCTSSLIYKGELLLSGESIDIVARRFNLLSTQAEEQFHAEIMTLSSLKHQNLVSYVGFCEHFDEHILITKFEAKGSLDLYLSDPVTLPWTQRLNICLDIARALSYIHYDKERDFSIIHRNIRSSKILLSDKWEAKLSGFEISVKQPSDRRHGLVHDGPRGMPEYMDPEYVRSGSVNYKSDVYSLGVVLFEVVSGRKSGILDNNKGLLAASARSSYEKGKLDEIVHSGLQKQTDSQSLKVFLEAAYYCLNEKRGKRPNIDQVILALENALKLQVARDHSRVAIEGASANHLKGKNLEHMKIGFEAIKKATENFSEKHRIGSGGYGAVYKAELEHYESSKIEGKSKLHKKRSTVAIKNIFNREDTQGEQGFFTEIESLSSCKHPNIVSLLGFCYKRPHMILVYEYISKGSLEDYLKNKEKMINLTWAQRIKICIDIACGLEYLHTATDNKQKIIHRDIKSGNILLDENWKVKIADFGLSKFYPHGHMNSTINATKVAGTQVYLDPEYEKSYKLKKAVDIYSFGVVLFEILTGRVAYDSIYINENEKGLAGIVQQHSEKGTLKELVDPKLMEETDEKKFIPSKGVNEDSLRTFCEIGCQCLAEKQAERPSMQEVINILERLYIQEIGDGSLQISFEDIKRATQDFSPDNVIGEEGFGTIYRGEMLLDNELTLVDVMRIDMRFRQGERGLMSEIENLFEYKHENIVSILGLCHENDETIFVFEYAYNRSLDRHVKDATLTWTKRLKIAIDVAKGLDFLHRGVSPHQRILHRDIRSANILLDGDWKAKVKFGWSIIYDRINSMDDDACDDAPGGGYTDPLYMKTGILTKESDIYSFGVVLLEMMCGRIQDPRTNLVDLVKREGKVDELVFEGIKDKIMPESLTTFQSIAYRCVHVERKKRPTTSDVVLQLKKALEFQEDHEIWEPKLPTHYEEITDMLKPPEKYTNIRKKDLYEMFSKGILFQDDKLCLKSDGNGKIIEMVSSRRFWYGHSNNSFQKWRSIKKSRFQSVAKMTNISNLGIEIKFRTQFLSPYMVYGAYIVFKFCHPRKCSRKLMYVNLKYQMWSETFHAYFATCEDDEWMMIELCRFTAYQKNVDVEFLLESMSRYYCGSDAIYLQGIHFRPISSWKTADQDPRSSLQLLSLSKENEKKFHMLPAKMVLYDSSNVKCFNWKSLANESSFLEVAELLSHQVFRIKCKIEMQKLSPDTDYACYLVFKLSEKCKGLWCPVKVRDVLLRKNKEFKFLYFRRPSIENLHNIKSVPKNREDGLMEVVVWDFNSGNKQIDDYLPMSLKLRCYEGTMSGLNVYGIEFRPI